MPDTVEVIATDDITLQLSVGMCAACFLPTECQSFVLLYMRVVQIFTIHTSCAWYTRQQCLYTATSKMVYKLITIMYQAIPSDADTEISWANEFNTMTTDVLAPCVTRSSAALNMIMWNKTMSLSAFLSMTLNNLRRFSVEQRYTIIDQIHKFTMHQSHIPQCISP